MQWKAEIEAAAQRIAGHAHQTPTLTTDGYGLGYPIELKLEHMQHTGSFKARGAFNTLLSCDVPPAGLVAASGGNHGAAVAFAAKALGHTAAIFVPEMAGPSKIALIQGIGADLTVVPGEYANALTLAKTYEIETGAMQIHAYDAPATVAGQGTCFAEWEAQGLQADTVLVAVGGGGLIAGALAWFQGARKVVAVEPETSCALNAALASGQPVDVNVSGVAANALGARRIGDICFELAQGMESVLVSDTAITAAQHALWQERRQLVEPAGATALAALMSGAYVPAPGERVAVLVCGGNIAPDPFAG
ncbi:threonine/serine dehydratase [Phaeobacter gallaeciensis]|uniref:Threonine/serine dehydratase n=2 Tax=Roseobacteraceae TaxID=2854170 RepID=A0A366X506_9RHOB|nr:MULTISPECIES: threonine/serine dehydratase [Roseobacteraceae]MBT3141993.1 threonine/serine dehydratase [Falsiruegeria litorea]MBT8168660.1 threonine/serine dehydratase [Falsiruegeria litorea]RBW60074.1 threonine/serine dehydratase [Phaeobacter gallaeciensis]